MTLSQTAPETAADVMGLNARVRAATAAQHRDTESRSFITELMGGKLSLTAYTAYLAQYAWVYQALEARIPQEGDPELLNDVRLHRFGALVTDLKNLEATDWQSEHPPLPATRNYVSHLDNPETHEPPRYLAHHYTRYLGDLSGGQAIAKLVARHYGATPAQLNFYQFDVSNPVDFKRAYRAAMDAIPFTAAEQEVFIAEAQRAFEFNGAIFDDLLKVVA